MAWHTTPLARPMPHGSMSNGVIVEASIVARLLGVKLLRLHAEVTLVPAQLEQAAVVEQRALPPATSIDLPRSPVDLESGTISDAVMLLQRATHTLRDAKRATAREGPS